MKYIFKVVVYMVLYSSFIFNNTNDTIYIEHNNKNFNLANGINKLIENPQKLNIPKYFGGWPYNPLKDKINGSNLYYDCPNDIGCECTTNNDCVNFNCKRSPRGSFCYPKSGDIFPEIISLDQYEENVNIYDFAYQNKYILIELGAVWCSPCNDLASWFAYKDDAIYNKSWWKNEYEQIYDLVHQDKIYFITILYEDENHDLVSYDTAYEWFDNYPDEKIPILLDYDKSLHSWVKPTGIPAVILLNQNMEIVTFSTRGLNSSFDKLLDLINSPNE